MPARWPVIWFLVGVAIGYAGCRLLARLGVLCWLSHHRYKFDRYGIAHCLRCRHSAIEGLD